MENELNYVRFMDGCDEDEPLDPDDAWMYRLDEDDVESVDGP